jgi:hypothetical protein
VSNQAGKPRIRIIDEAGSGETVNRDIDDTTGHLARSGRIDEADTDTTEAHGANEPGKPRVRIIDEAGNGDTDTEAHSANQPGKPRIRLIDEAADDESTEGHPRHK